MRTRFLALSAALLATATHARAQTAEAGPESSALSVDVEEAPEQDLPLIPAAEDRRSGHFAGFLGGALAVPFGGLSERIAFADAAAPGFALTLELGYGVSRTVSLGLFAEATYFGEPDACPGCSARSYAAGPLVRYHLTQGVRLDPWASVGLGFRSTELDDPADSSFLAVEWLRLELGADYYASPLLGLGPYLSLAASSAFDRPDRAGGTAIAWIFGAGLRFGVDLPGH
jgi:hypothetical protein